MESSSLEQIWIFIIFILNGIFIGTIFDLCRVFRKCFKVNDIITYFQDIIFWIITGVSIIFLIYKINYGEIRLYIFIGILIGIITYIIFLSKKIINIATTVISTILDIINIVIIKPIKYIIKIYKKIFDTFLQISTKYLKKICKKNK